MPKGKAICVKVYLNPVLFSEVCKFAEKAGSRRLGLLPYTQKKNGMKDDKLANTDGIARYLKKCHKLNVDTELERLNQLAKIKTRETDLALKQKELDEEKIRLGNHLLKKDED